MVALNVGCGPVRFAGEIGVDLFSVAACDVRGDLLALPFLDGAVDAIRIDHVLEHIDQRLGYQAVREAFRVLRAGGAVRVGVPDVAQYCAEWASSDAATKAHLLRGLYGGQIHAGEYHRAGYDPAVLADLLDAVGFVDVVVAEDTGPFRLEGYCIAAVGRKP